MTHVIETAQTNAHTQIKYTDKTQYPSTMPPVILSHTRPPDLLDISLSEETNGENNYLETIQHIRTRSGVKASPHTSGRKENPGGSIKGNNLKGEILATVT